MSDSTQGYLPGRRVGPLRRKHMGESYEVYEAAEVRNGLPHRENYIRRTETRSAEREAEVRATISAIRRQVAIRRKRYATLRKQGLPPRDAARQAGVKMAGSFAAYERWYQGELAAVRS